MTDNGSGYVSRLFRKACRLLRLRHLRTRPYTPKTNGKAERFIQTLLREWAYALPYRSSDSRAADLPRWLRHYNQERPHASLARQSPTAWLQAHALNNVFGNHTPSPLGRGDLPVTRGLFFALNAFSLSTPRLPQVRVVRDHLSVAQRHGAGPAERRVWSAHRQFRLNSRDGHAMATAMAKSSTKPGSAGLVPKVYDFGMSAPRMRSADHARPGQPRWPRWIGVTYQQAHKYREERINRVAAGRLYHIARALDVEVGLRC